MMANPSPPLAYGRDKREEDGEGTVPPSPPRRGGGQALIFV